MESQTCKTDPFFFWPVRLSVMCERVVDTCTRVSSHSQIQLIKWEKTFRGDAVESLQEGGAGPRWLMGDVVRRRSRHIQICVYAWNNPSTVNPHEVLRQSLSPELLLMFGVTNSGPVLLELSCGLVREGSHLLVYWWNYNPGGKGEERWEEKGGRELLYSPAVCLKRSSDYTQLLFGRHSTHKRKPYSCWTSIKTSRQHSTLSQSCPHTHFRKVAGLSHWWNTGGHIRDMRLYEGEGRHEEQSGSGRQADITNRAQMMTMMTGMSWSGATLTLLVAARLTDP